MIRGTTVLFPKGNRVWFFLLFLFLIFRFVLLEQLLMSFQMYGVPVFIELVPAKT